MIRVNLLAGERPATKRRAAFGIGQKVPVLCSLILVLTALGIGWRYWSLTRDSAQLDLDIAAAERETARLRTLIQQVRQFDQRKMQLQQRVALTEELRTGQSGPVHLLDQVSRSLPDGLWLIEMKQQGADVTLEGRCVTLTSLSDLISNLSASGYFSKGVEILDSQVESAAQPGATELIHFSVKGQFSMPEPAAN